MKIPSFFPACMLMFALTSCTNPFAPVPPTMTPPPATEINPGSTIDIFSGVNDITSVASSETTTNTPPINPQPQTTQITPSEGLAGKKLCVSTICIRADKPYFEFEDSYVQFYTNTKIVNDESITLDPKDYIYAKTAGITTYSDSTKMITSSDTEVMDAVMIQIKKDGGTANYNEMWMGGEFKTIKKMPKNIFMIQKGTGSCGGANIEQYFINEKNVGVSLDDAVGQYPKNFQVANINFTSYVPDGNVLYQGVANLPDAPEKIKEIWSIHDDIGAKITDKILSSQHFNGSYALEFQEYPGTVFFYKSGVENAIAVIKVDTKGKKIDKDGTVQDRDLTREIFGYYKPYDESKFYIPQSIQKKGAKEYKVYTADDIAEIIPVFRIKPFTNGYYFLYTTSKYASLPLAEMCKPVVYVYDHEGKNRSLQVNLTPGGVFTKIIPDFNTNTRWDFRANDNSQIVSPGNTEVFPYLYYSADIPGYEFNTHGWQVWGHDVEGFFNEKLSKIQFNDKEKSDFIDYWKNEFRSDTLYFISFKFNEDIEKYVGLSFSEKPASSLRVLMEAYPLDPSMRKPNYAWPEVGTKLDDALLRTFERTGKFDVLEWGGTVYKTLGDVTIY